MYQIALEQMTIRAVDRKSTLRETIDNMIDMNYKHGKNPIQNEAELQVKDKNRLSQRRFYLTPTVKVLRPM